jgi:hypothetical protein
MSFKTKLSTEEKIVTRKIFATSTALCLGENFNCARASGTHALCINLSRNFIFRGLCGKFFFRATATSRILTGALLILGAIVEK